MRCEHDRVEILAYVAGSADSGPRAVHWCTRCGAVRISAKVEVSATGGYWRTPSPLAGRQTAGIDHATSDDRESSVRTWLDTGRWDER